MYSIALRHYVLTHDNEIFRISNAKFDRLIQGGEQGQFKLFSGLKVRMAEILVSLVDRKPIEVLRASYSHLYFDAQGNLDHAQYHGDIAVTLELIMPDFMGLGADKNVIYANQQFAKRKRDGTVFWKPNSKLECELFDIATGRIKCRSL